jgi:serine/threonine protein kinase/tetratricopeptide (TPR) repeat protein
MDKPPPTGEEAVDRDRGATSPAGQTPPVDPAYTGDSALADKVKALLREFDESGTLLAQAAHATGETETHLPGSATPEPTPPAEPGSLAPVADRPTPVEGPGTRIGPYRLIRELGEGGMGAVYLAEQDQPIRRQVALKIIKPGMDTAGIVARFQAERQALTRMEHPNIAQVFDAGTTETGRPYFVMELVQGIPLTRFCNEHRLAVRERLQMFEAVCQAIQHAHTKGVMHRDIKPSNVLVAVKDGQPTVKVIDFGLAKAIDEPLTDQSQMTQAGALVGTLEYMSPEQADPSGRGVDTRTDIYSLGVMLYELLTGTTPLDHTTLPGMGLLDVVVRILDEEVARPSTRVAALGDRLPAAAAERGTEPARLGKLLCGELDWITLKALDKDRDRRYETASAFAADVRRFLNDEPVEACPPSARYRLGKFVRKHRVLLATVASIMVVLLAAIVAVNDARKKAVSAEAETHQALDTSLKAQQVTRTALRSLDAVIETMVRSRTQIGEPERTILRQVVAENKQLPPVGPKASQEALVTAAETQFRMAGLAMLLGEAEDAQASYRKAIGLYEILSGEFPDNVGRRFDLARCSFDLGLVLGQQGKPADARTSYRRAIDILQALMDAYPRESKYCRELADAYNNLGVLLRDAQEFPQAAEAFGKAIALGERARAEDPRSPELLVNLAANYHNLGNALRDQGGNQVQAALESYGKAIQLLAPIKNPTDKAKEFLRNAHWDRANALGQLHQHTAAVRDWQRALELEEGDKQPLRCFLEAEQAEEKIQAQTSPPGKLLYDAAAATARAARAVAAFPEEERLQKRHVRRTLELLKLAQAAGWFRDPERVKRLREDESFSKALPEREFKAFLGGL